MSDWKEAAAEYFFHEKKSINDIAEATGISRQSVSSYLNQYPGYHEERSLRKQRNAEKRRHYKRNKNKEYRSNAAVSMAVTKETLKHEHDVAAAILSAERY